MDKTRLYHILDIASPEEFQYYENLAALLEEDEFIEENLIKDIVKDVDKEFYITVESIMRVFDGMIFEDMGEHEINELAAEIAKFRKWYVHDLNAFNRLNAEECNIRDARYDIVAAGLLGDDFDYDFRTALDYELEGFSVRVADIIDK